MKKIIIVALFLIVSCPLSMIGQDAETDNLTVYYFHNTHRCMSCNAIEAQTRETLDTFFKDELEDGEIKLLVLNAEEKDNLPLAEKYEVWGASLLLVTGVGENEKVENLTDLGFAKARTKPEEFRKELKSEIDKYLN